MQWHNYLSFTTKHLHIRKFEKFMDFLPKLISDKLKSTSF